MVKVGPHVVMDFYVVLLLLIVIVVVDTYEVEDAEQIRQLVLQWAPLIWMSPNESHYPASVDHFIRNMHLVDATGTLISSRLNETHFPRTSDSRSLYLATRTGTSTDSFLNGTNPKENSVPIYAVVTPCTPYMSFHSSTTNTIKDDVEITYEKTTPKTFFHVSYWSFYPYNKGKTFCFLGKVPTITLFGRCFGRPKTIGSHVGDWEHVSLSFRGNLWPSEMYLAVHDAGGYYRYDPARNYFKFDARRRKKTSSVQKPKFPLRVRMQGGHPVLFAAEGSHGLWSSPGDHEYVKIPKLIDKCGYGTPWKTWSNIKMYNLGVDQVPPWMKFKGKWGNPKSNCVLFRKLGFCEHTDGPFGILRNDQEFYC